MYNTVSLNSVNMTANSQIKTIKELKRKEKSVFVLMSVLTCSKDDAQTDADWTVEVTHLRTALTQRQIIADHGGMWSSSQQRK